ncbi:MAG: hypothetical protein KC492_01595, partial [Myxococcales bacterium]|nr:hypothetical protein [Myxococcales bacterium]
MVQVDLVNSGAEVVDFTVTVGESLPSVQLGKLQRGSKSLALSCMRYMITTRVTLRIELEPGGTLQFSTPLYANDSLSDRYRGEGEYAILSPSSGCDAKPL